MPEISLQSSDVVFQQSKRLYNKCTIQVLGLELILGDFADLRFLDYGIEEQKQKLPNTNIQNQASKQYTWTILNSEQSKSCIVAREGGFQKPRSPI